MERYNTKYLLKRIFLDNIAYRYKFLTFCIFILSCLLLINAIYFSKYLLPYIINYICYKDHAHANLIFLVLISSIVCLIKASLEFTLKFFVKKLGYNILFNIQRDLYTSVIANFNSISLPVGKILSKFSNDILMLRGLLSEFLFHVVRNFMHLIASIFVMLWIDYKIFTLLFCIMIIGAFIINKLSIRLKNMAKTMQGEFANIQSALNKVFSYMKNSKNNDFLNDKKKPYLLIDKVDSLYSKFILYDTFTMFLFEIFAGISLIIIIIACCTFCEYIRHDFGKVTGLCYAYIRQWQVLKSILMVNTNLQEGLSASDRIFNLMDGNFEEQKDAENQ